MSVVSTIKGIFSDDEDSGENAATTTMITERSDERRDRQGYNSYTYPPEIFSTEYINNFLVCRRLKWSGNTKNYHTYSRYRKSATTQQKNSDFITLSYLNLYMPTLTETIEQNYEDAKVSLAAEAVTKLSDAYKSGGQLTDTLKSVAGVYAGAAVGGVANLVSNAIQQTQNRILTNPVAGSYTGPSRRSQTMKFAFAPRSLTELKTVANIIQEFYRGALTSSNSVIDTNSESFNTGADISLISYTVPDVWFLEEVSNTNFSKYTHRFVFGPAAITSIRLNKTPDEYWMTFKYTAGDPAVMELEVTFQELAPYTLEMFENDLDSDIGGYTGDQTTLRG